MELLFCVLSLWPLWCCLCVLCMMCVVPQTLLKQKIKSTYFFQTKFGPGERQLIFCWNKKSLFWILVSIQIVFKKRKLKLFKSHIKNSSENSPINHKLKFSHECKRKFSSLNFNHSDEVDGLKFRWCGDLIWSVCCLQTDISQLFVIRVTWPVLTHSNMNNESVRATLPLY